MNNEQFFVSHKYRSKLEVTIVYSSYIGVKHICVCRINKWHGKLTETLFLHAYVDIEMIYWHEKRCCLCYRQQKGWGYGPAAPLD